MWARWVCATMIGYLWHFRLEETGSLNVILMVKRQAIESKPECIFIRLFGFKICDVIFLLMMHAVNINGSVSSFCFGDPRKTGEMSRIHQVMFSSCMTFSVYNCYENRNNDQLIPNDQMTLISPHVPWSAKNFDLYIK